MACGERGRATVNENFMRDFFHMPTVDIRTMKIQELQATLAALREANANGLMDAYKIRNAAQKLIDELFPTK